MRASRQPCQRGRSAYRSTCSARHRRRSVRPRRGHLTAGRRAVIKSPPHRWLGRKSTLRPSGRLARLAYLCIGALDSNVRFCRRQGLPDCHGVGTSVRRCMPHGVRHPDREADHRSWRSGRAAGTAARMIRVPPVSSIWIQSGDGHRPLRGVQRVGPRQAAMPGYAAAESAAPAQAVRAQEDANARSVHLPVPASR